MLTRVLAGIGREFYCGHNGCISSKFTIVLVESEIYHYCETGHIHTINKERMD